MNYAKIFGSNVFSDSVMCETLSKEIYSEFRRTIDEGLPLDPQIAEVVAGAMKDWAIRKGATHYTHWFQPLNGYTAEKHESFITPIGDGRAIMEFSGKMLIKGEPDASAFPSGGLRATFEARGYTSWDCTSPAFLKENASGVILCIPTAFCSYKGEALDHKTPLLRSMEAVNKHALRILRLFGDEKTAKVFTCVGAEQEYFLISKEYYNKRKDLIFTGQTLFGAKPPKTQEMEGHYYGVINERVAAYMKELDAELWKMGVAAKTKHNEAAPSQHELVPVFTTVNIAVDHDQLIMETMKRVADRHGLTCLLHEKPFEYISGSAKHNNWSMQTDIGQNLFDPGKTPQDNAQFLLFLLAVIKAIDKHEDLLRLSVASASNDLRLGSHEAPPSIISVFIGDELLKILEHIKCGDNSKIKIEQKKIDFQIPTMSRFNIDSTDRNRTSPFAFTGNKFEFRMPGASMPIGMLNVILNTIIADSLNECANRLEKEPDFVRGVNNLLKELATTHDRVIFNGNGYSFEWAEEACKRGLPSIKDTPDAIPALLHPKSSEMFELFGIFSIEELKARSEILSETYVNDITLKAGVMLDMTARDIYPAGLKYVSELANQAQALQKYNDESLCLPIYQEVAKILREIQKRQKELRDALDNIKNVVGGALSRAIACRDLLPLMKNLRESCDLLELLADRNIWRFPTYLELIFNM